MSGRINVGPELAALVAKLGLVYEDVHELTITPVTARAVVMLRDGDGNKQIIGEALATETRDFSIWTDPEAE